MRTLPEDTMPAIEAELVGGGQWRLAEEHPAQLALLVFYRGFHCAGCRDWLMELDRLAPRFLGRGVSVIALSCDHQDHAELARLEWHLHTVRIGYGVDPEDARKAGLYLTEEQGHVFTEPAVLAVRPEEGTLYAAWIQSHPEARPPLGDVLLAIDGMLAKGLPPPRGAG